MMNAKTRFPKADLLVLIVFSFLSVSQTLCADTTTQALEKKVPEVVSYLQDRSLTNVGVLKFRVKKPGEKTSDSVGPINALIADRLEVGLALAAADHRAINVIKDASQQAQRLTGANHLTEKGRSVLFNGQFKLAWKSSPVKADAFLTGVIQVGKDNRSAKIGLLCFDKSGGTLTRIGDVIDVELDPAMLGELGESFMTRGAFDGGMAKGTDFTLGTSSQSADVNAPPKFTKVALVENAAKVKQGLVAFPLQNEKSPVRLEVFYDGQSVPLTIQSGRAFIREPLEGQNVEMVITKNPSMSGRVGVVLKVNGENTLYRQTARDVSCSKWVLSDSKPRKVIKGYQVRGSRTAEKFRVMSNSESAARAVNYGRNVGQIQMTIFAEKNLSTFAALADEEEFDEDLLAMERGLHPKDLPDSPADLKAALLESVAVTKDTQPKTAAPDGGLVTRGLIVQGSKTASGVKSVGFQPNPTPIMSATVTYYQP